MSPVKPDISPAPESAEKETETNTLSDVRQAAKGEQEGDERHIAKPDSGSTEVLTVKDEAKLLFDFSLDDVKFSLTDVDLVITFPDGAKIILLDFGMQITTETLRQMEFSGTDVSSEDILARIGQFDTSNVPESASYTSADSEEESEEEKKAAEAESEAQAEETPAEVEEEETKGKEFSTESSKEKEQNIEGEGDGEAEESRSRIEDKIAESENENTSTSSSSSPPADPVDEVNPGLVDLPVSDVEIRLLGVADQEVSALAGGGVEIRGSGATTAAVTDDAYGVQSTSEQLTGTGNNDIIYADDPNAMPAGTFVRLLEINATMPQAGWEPTAARITGLPDGYAILDATNDNGSFLVTPDPDDPNKIFVKLRYTLPDSNSVADGNGFLETFSLNIDYSVDNGGQEGQTSATARFAIRDVYDSEDAEFVDGVTDESVYILSRNPTGNIIDAGAGDDQIYSGAGGDLIDGGSGVDQVSYAQSHEAVDVNLTAGTASGGYANNDTLTGIESLEGSAYADQLTGDGNDNILTGGAGSDTLVGGAGQDTAVYSSSDAGVNVDLATGVGAGGDATGDTLSGIENLTGSQFSDTLTGDANANILSGGAGDDTLIGAGGADTLDGGTGTDLADYSTSSAGVGVDLTTGLGTGGDAQGDVLSNIENLNGSAFADTLSGDTGVNILNGGTGGDTLAGGAGNDTLNGESGNDTLTGGAGSDLLFGGAGEDTADYSTSGSAVTVNLGTSTGVGGDAHGDVLNGIENLSGSSQADNLTGDENNNVLSGAAGNDTISGAEGDDTLDGGLGSDLLDGGAGDDTLLGGDGNDTLVGEEGADSLDGGEGNDSLSGGAGDDQLVGGGGDDVLEWGRRCGRS